MTLSEMTDTGAQPTILNPSVKDDQHTLQEAFNEPTIQVYDLFCDQLRDLFKTRKVGSTRSTQEHDHLADQAMAQGDASVESRWVFYPWTRRLVHVLGPNEFQELRCNRNQYKILPDEQQTLRRRRIGIVGLSVGHSAALTLAMEGIAGHYRLADFDSLDLSNLNRIRTGIHNLGVNKAVLTAREMYELDPYLNIELFTEGVTHDNMEDFFGTNDPLDLLVEECDDLFAKIRLRERARELQIPVVMDTSDGGLLDIERFDLEPDRPLFHGVLPGVDAEKLVGLTTKEKVPIALAILDAQKMSCAMAASLVEIDNTLSTWPQLGSAVALGGALVAHAARSIFLGNLQSSGRFRVDLDHLVASGREEPPPSPMASVEICASEQKPPVPPAPPLTSTVDTVFINYVLAFATCAPSAGNAQPWRFTWDAPILNCYIDPRRSSFLDYGFIASKIALGAAVENISLAAANLGYKCHCEISAGKHDHPESYSLRFQKQSQVDSDRFHQIFRRRTNRKLGDASQLTIAEEKSFHQAAAASQGQVRIVRDPHDIRTIGRILGQFDRHRFLSPVMRTELLSEFRWSAADVEATRDGLSMATLEMNATDRAALEILRRADVNQFLETISGGHAIGDATMKASLRASAMVLVTVPTGPAAAFRGGRCMQTVWLEATKQELELCPQGALFLKARATARNHGLDAHRKTDILRLLSELEHVLELPSDQQVAMLFRCSRSPEPTAFSLRRDIDSVFENRSASNSSPT